MALSVQKTHHLLTTRIWPTWLPSAIESERHSMIANLFSSNSSHSDSIPTNEFQQLHMAPKFQSQTQSQSQTASQFQVQAPTANLPPIQLHHQHHHHHQTTQPSTRAPSPPSTPHLPFSLFSSLISPSLQDTILGISNPLLPNTMNMHFSHVRAFSSFQGPRTLVSQEIGIGIGKRERNTGVEDRELVGLRGEGMRGKEAEEKREGKPRSVTKEIPTREMERRTRFQQMESRILNVL